MPITESHRKCFKCGCSPVEHNVKLFRFPKPSIYNHARCKLWAKFIFPDRDCGSESLQNNLYREHRMLCQNHFDDKAFNDESKQRLIRGAIPHNEENNTDEESETHNQIDVPVDHQYSLMFTPHISDANIDASPNSTSTTYKKEIHNNMIRFNGKLTDDIDELHDQETFDAFVCSDNCDEKLLPRHQYDEQSLETSSPDQCEPALKIEVICSDDSNASSVTIEETHPQPLEDLSNQTTSRTHQVCDNMEQTPHSTDLPDQVISDEIFNQKILVVRDDVYARFGLHIGNMLRKYDSNALAYIKEELYRAIRQADIRKKQRDKD